MAIVHRLVSQELEVETPHTHVEGTFSVVNQDGQRCLQIDTYGSSGRKIPGKKSQSIRFAPSALEQLRRILQEHFPSNA